MMDSAGRKDGRGMFALAGAVVVLVLAAPCMGWAAAGLTQVFTHDPRTVVRVTLAAVWCAELVLFAVLAALLVRRRIGVLRSAGVSSQECAAERLRLKSRYILIGAFWAAVLGYACFKVYRSLELGGLFPG